MLTPTLIATLYPPAKPAAPTSNRTFSKPILIHTSLLVSIERRERARRTHPCSRFCRRNFAPIHTRAAPPFRNLHPDVATRVSLQSSTTIHTSTLMACALVLGYFSYTDSYSITTTTTLLLPLLVLTVPPLSSPLLLLRCRLLLLLHLLLLTLLIL